MLYKKNFSTIFPSLVPEPKHLRLKIYPREIIIIIKRESIQRTPDMLAARVLPSGLMEPKPTADVDSARRTGAKIETRQKTK